MRAALVSDEARSDAAVRQDFPSSRVLIAATVGYLVPGAPFDAVVHGVYKRACNLLVGDSLVVLATCESPDGPASVRLGGKGAIDLRAWFRVGEAIRRESDRLASLLVRIDLHHAKTWTPLRPAAHAAASSSLVNRILARTRLASRRSDQASVLHREGGVSCSRLERACRNCDLPAAACEVSRLIGWGEGLTPAGDDFLVGLLAALHALVGRDGERRAFLDDLAAIVARAASRTTPLAAHYLRLASSRHFNADVHDLRDALLTDPDASPLQHVLDAVLSRGATSGADLLTGMLAGIDAWSDPSPASRPAITR